MLKDNKRAHYTAVNDSEVLEAFSFLSKKEEIIPALESAHAIAYVRKNVGRFDTNDIVAINLSGRGDKNVNEVSKIMRCT